jgi:hypothetical protein
MKNLWLTLSRYISYQVDSAMNPELRKRIKIRLPDQVCELIEDNIGGKIESQTRKEIHNAKHQR